MSKIGDKCRHVYILVAISLVYTFDDCSSLDDAGRTPSPGVTRVVQLVRGIEKLTQGSAHSLFLNRKYDVTSATGMDTINAVYFLAAALYAFWYSSLFGSNWDIISGCAPASASVSSVNTGVGIGLLRWGAAAAVSGLVSVGTVFVDAVVVGVAAIFVAVS